MGTTFGNVPVCWSCWYGRNPHRLPVRVRNNQPRQCGYCGKTTVEGIAVRDRWANAPHAVIDGEGNAVWTCAYGRTDMPPHPGACTLGDACACTMDSVLDTMRGRVHTGERG